MDYPLKSLNSSLRLLFTAYLAVLAFGYCAALLQVFLSSGMADGKFGLSFDDIVYSYYGGRSHSLLENKLNGSMRGRLPQQERTELIQWLHDGAHESTFEPRIKAIFGRYCVSCHNPAANRALPDFTQFNAIKTRSAADHGISVTALTRVSHIHLFGIAFIFLSVGLIFAFSSCLPPRLKNPVIVSPYVFLSVDVASWWLTKIAPAFAWLVIVGGVGLVLAFLLMWTVSIYEMWFMRAKT